MADAVWIQERITRTRETIVSIENAVTALVSGAQSYTLDTGQTRQTVTKANLAELKNSLSYYEGRLRELEAELGVLTNGSASLYVTPGF